MRYAALALSAAIMLAAVNCSGEPEETALLRIEETAFMLEDFQEYLAEEGGDLETIDQELLDSYIERFAERKILVYAADKAGIEAPEGTFSQHSLEGLKIGQYLLQEAEDRYSENLEWIQKVQDKIQQIYEKRYNQERYEIQTVFFSNERDADRAFSTLRSNPSRISRYLENNPEEMKQGMGQGVFTLSQLYETARDKVLAIKDQVISRKRPMVTEKIPVEEGGGYILVLLRQVQPPASLDDAAVNSLLQEIVYSEERELLRRTVLEELSGELDIVLNKDIAYKALKKS